MSIHASDGRLIEASLRGDTHAFTRLIERYQGLVCAVTLATTCDRATSEDLAQETFITAWRSLPQLREPGNFRAWLCGIARNLGRAAQRRRDRERPLDDETVIANHGDSPDEALATAESEALVWRVLEEIPETYREPLILYYREGQSAVTVAERLGISVSAVEQRLSRGRKVLRAEVERSVEQALTRSRPSTRFTAAIVAALPPAPPSLGATAGVSSTSTTSKGTTMLKILAGVTALTATASGAFLCSGQPTEHHEEVAVHSKAPTSAKSEGSDRRHEPLDAATLDEARRVAADAVVAPKGAVPYELTRIGPAQVAVSLEGGPSELFTPEEMVGAEVTTPELPIIRTIRGRVKDAQGRAVHGAVVVGGPVLSQLIGKSLSGRVGALSDEQGMFEVSCPDQDALVLLAMHHEAGWSRLVSVAPGGDDPRLDLELRSPAGLAVQVTVGGQPAVAHAIVRSTDFSSESKPQLQMMAETDPAGRLSISALPAGRLTIAVAAGNRFDRGVAPRYEERTVELRAGQREEIAVDLTSGAMLFVAARWPEDWPVTTVTYQWVAGRRTLVSEAELSALIQTLPTEQHGYLLVGGEDRDGGVQFVDLPETEVTVCATAKNRRDPVAFTCKAVSIESATEAGELELVLRERVDP